MSCAKFAATAFILASLMVASATTYYVDGMRGDDAAVGTSSRNPLKSIQAAADKVNPGDTVVVAPGVYYESVAIRRFGTQDAPITFMADRVEKDRVIITGARRAIREKKVPWRLDDAELGLYSIPCEGTDFPSRVLYSGADLYPYRTLELLKRFHVVKAINETTSDENPGPRHGYTWVADEQRLYVRLHASGRYGSRDPNEHLMSVGPEPDGVSYGNTTPIDDGKSNVRIIAGGATRKDIPNGWPAHVVLDGFTFETPSLTGVYTSASDVIVRNCWFVGCRLGVSGNGQMDRMSYYRRSPNRVRVHHCDYTQWPTYEDGVESITAAGESGKKLFWHRKHANEGLPGNRFMYETGIIGWAALDWEVDHNRIHSVFEAFSAKGTTQSESLRIHDNLFDKLLDNAVEFEDAAQNMSVYRNVIRDTFSPISWQPLRGKPLPGPGFVYQNVIYNTPEHLKTFSFRKTAVFKIFGPCFGKIQPPGMLIFNNTIYWHGNAPVIGGTAPGHHPDRIAFINNIIAGDYCFMVGCTEWDPVEGFVMARNLTGSIDPRVFAHKVMAGKDGIALDDYTQIGFSNVESFDLSVRADSPGVGKAMAVPGVDLRFKDIGAVQQGDTWYPPAVGPQRGGTGVEP